MALKYAGKYDNKDGGAGGQRPVRHVAKSMEAKRVLVEGWAAVACQNAQAPEFNPAKVKGYRLIGL